MAKKKANIRGKPKPRAAGENPGVKSGLTLGRLLRFFVLPPVRRLLLLVLILVVLFWQREGLSSWATGVAEGTMGLFGWGMVLIAIAVITVAGIVFRHQLSAFVRRWKLYQWNKWLGAAAFLLAVWGILALFDLGGSFGLGIIADDQGPIGVLRVLGLAALGMIFVAPRACLRAIKRSILWLFSPLKMPAPPPRPSPEEAQLPHRPV